MIYLLWKLVLFQTCKIVKWKLTGETAQVLIEKQKTENPDTATYQDFLSKYADMRLEEGSCVTVKIMVHAIVKAHLLVIRRCKWNKKHKYTDFCKQINDA